jgi:hypothetical protein
MPSSRHSLPGLSRRTRLSFPFSPRQKDSIAERTHKPGHRGAIPSPSGHLKGLLPATPSSPDATTSQSLWFHRSFLTRSNVLSGSILVKNRGGKISIGQAVATPKRYSLKADSIAVLAGSTIQSNIFYNALGNSGGTISGSSTTPLTLPLGNALPAFESGTPGSNDYVLSNGQTATLPAGNYNNVILQPHSTLFLTPGWTYNFKTLLVKSNAQLLFNAPAHVRIVGGFEADQSSYVGPANGSSITQSDIVFYVQTVDQTSSFVKASLFGPSATIFANVYTPNGTIWLEDGTSSTGAYVATDVLVGKKVTITLGTAFSGLAKSSSGWDKAPTASILPSEIPTNFSLSQNFPNPFNPSTEIRYGLPKASRVTLTIYNALGQEVAQLADEMQDAGYHQMRWNGTNRNGLPVSTGVYFYRLRAEGFVDIKKMLLVK